MMLLTPIGAIVLALLAFHGDGDDYKLLKGAALKKFEKTAASVEKGKKIAIELPGDCLDATNIKKWKDSKTQCTLHHRGVDYVFDGTDPYVAQAQRKAGERKNAVVLVKGSVAAFGKGDNERCAVVVDTMQVIDKTPRRKKSTKEKS